MMKANWKRFSFIILTIAGFILIIIGLFYIISGITGTGPLVTDSVDDINLPHTEGEGKLDKIVIGGGIFLMIGMPLAITGIIGMRSLR